MKVDWLTFWPRLVEATGETLYMVSSTLFFGTILGLTLGVLLYVSRDNHLLENKFVFNSLNFLINLIRPIPFIIFILMISPVTRQVIGTTIGTTAAIFPMTIVASFSIARIVENNLISIDTGVIEAAQSMGAGPVRIIFTVLIPEALGPLILGLTFMTISLIDFSAVAGIVGGGGLGHVAMTYGYQRYDVSVITVTVLILIILVHGAQWLGNTVSKKIMRR